MAKKLIKMTEQDLHEMIRESVKRVLKEGSYDSNGEFNQESHDEDRKRRFVDELNKLQQAVGDSQKAFMLIQQTSTMPDDEISYRARKINEAIVSLRNAIRNITQLSNADRFDLSAD
jgi:hypothetical protein